MQMKKVLLVQPPEPKNMPLPVTLPLGLCCVAAYLEDVAEVRIISATLDSAADVVERVRSFQPDLVGITNNYTLVTDMNIALAGRIKELGDIPVVFGGPGAQFLRRYILNSGVVDMVVRGEGELTIRELVRKGTPEGVAGLTYRRDGQIIDNPPRELIADLDGKRRPAYHLVDGIPAVHPVESSRGCLFDCDFCVANQFYGRTYRAMSPARLAEQVKFLAQDFGAWYITFYDDNFGLDMKRVAEFCDLVIAEGLQVMFSASFRADALARNPGVVEKMARAGFGVAMLGIESASDYTLQVMNKRINREQIQEAVKLLKSHGIFTEGLFALGYPHETEHMLFETVDFALALDLDAVNFNILTPYPGTRLYERARDSGDLLTERWIDYDQFTRVLKSTLPGIEEVCRRMHRKFYIRIPWIKDNFSVDEKNPVKSLYARACWLSTCHLRYGGPSTTGEWVKTLTAFGQLSSDALQNGQPGYRADVLFRIRGCGQLLLKIRNGVIQEISETENNGEIEIDLNNGTLVELFGAGRLDALSMFMAGLAGTTAATEQLLPFINWCNDFQEAVMLNPMEAPSYDPNTIVHVLNEQRDGTGVEGDAQRAIGDGSNTLVFDLHDGKCSALQLRAGTQANSRIVDAGLFRQLLTGDPDVYGRLLSREDIRADGLLGSIIEGLASIDRGGYLDRLNVRISA
ncbi:B12-binding domain-containing radical SAM protein [Desulfotomaculum copahuensis]|uniref:Uncharacterized protein n=1 Tax=Desulfotomaculum copahuensis TaxID=1838280 RepID=A0A1B7LFW7_9FIRM|nr:radical SAM protein [Desulfotomaculum copahuensis]OAT83609.1 hypothetical protein A6M21_07960 [Desulfotomaculum copahuensis]